MLFVSCAARGSRGCAAWRHDGARRHDDRPAPDRLEEADLIAFAKARAPRLHRRPVQRRPALRAHPPARASRALDEEGLNAQALDRLARRARETEAALAHLTAEVEARSAGKARRRPRAVRRADSDRAADPDAAHRRSGGRDASRIGLEKIETLAAVYRRPQGAAGYGANVGGAIVRLTAKGRLNFAPEPPGQAASPRRPPMADAGPADWLVAISESILSNLKHLRRHFRAVRLLHAGADARRRGRRAKRERGRFVYVFLKNNIPYSSLADRSRNCRFYRVPSAPRGGRDPSCIGLEKIETLGEPERGSQAAAGAQRQCRRRARSAHRQRPAHVRP